MNKDTSRKNPSRKECENIIKRILMTEYLENGSNRHFKTASDFMNYFESLYLPSDSLLKQVQRAIKALDMPKDEAGYFIVNKTVRQHEQDKDIRNAFEMAGVSVATMDLSQAVFISAKPSLQDYLIQLLNTSETFKGKIITILPSSNGLLIYTNNASQLEILLNSLTI